MHSLYFTALQSALHRPATPARTRHRQREQTRSVDGKNPVSIGIHLPNFKAVDTVNNNEPLESQKGRLSPRPDSLINGSKVDFVVHALPKTAKNGSRRNVWVRCQQKMQTFQRTLHPRFYLDG